MRRPSFPTVISLIALFVALGGTSYAVVKLPAKSVGNRELKSNAVTSAKIRARSVGRSDLAPSARVGSRGPRGAAGPAGPAGPAGHAAAAASVEAWQPLRMIGSWSYYLAGYPPAAYRKDSLGKVHLRGLVKRAGVPVQETLAVLPSSHAPAVLVEVAAIMGAGANAAGRVQVTASGEILWISGPAGDANYTSLDNISFWTD